MEPGLLILLVPVFVIFILYFLPELLRWLSQRNRQEAGTLKAALADTGEALRTFAARLRPYRDLHAGTFRRHYEPARDRLQKVVDTYQHLSRRLAEVAPPDRPFGLWAFVHIVNHPQEIWQTPITAVRLWRLKREIDRLRGKLDGAESLISRTEETPGGLVQAARQVREQRLAKLSATLSEEAEAGLATANDLQARLAQLQRQTDMLLETMENGPSTGLGRMDTFASELEQLEEAATALESEANTLRRQRRAVEARLGEVSEARDAALSDATEEEVRRALRPMLERAKGLENEAHSLQRAERFAEAEETAGEALEILQLGRELASVAGQVHSLREAADVSLQAEAIEVLDRRLQTTLRAAYDLCDAGQDSTSPARVAANGGGESAPAEEQPKNAANRRSEIVDGLRLRVSHLATEAEKIQEAHEQDVIQIAAEADEESARLNEAWQALQETVTIAGGDPALKHYRALQLQRTEAGGNPLALRAYLDDARSLTNDLKTAADTIRHGFRQLEALRIELPGMLEKAEVDAQNWRCLQPLLLEMKEAIATLWQIGSADVHLAEMQATLSEIETLEEQVRAAYAALDGERRRLAVLERRITQMLQTKILRRSHKAVGQTEGGEFSGGEKLRARVESSISAARATESIEATHAELHATLDWMEDDS